MAVLCRFGEAPRITQIHANRKNRVGSPRRGDPRFRRERAVYEILPQRRQGAEIETKNCSRPTLLGRRVRTTPASYLICECRLTSFRLLRCPHGLTRRHEATKRKRPQSCRKNRGFSRRHGDTEGEHCSNGSPLPFWLMELQSQLRTQEKSQVSHFNVFTGELHKDRQRGVAESRVFPKFPPPRPCASAGGFGLGETRRVRA